VSYSRSKTHQQARARRRGKTRWLLAVNGILLVCILVVIAIVWKAKDDSGDVGAPPAQSGQAGSAEPSAAGTPVPEASEPAEGTDEDGEVPATEASADPEEDAGTSPSGESAKGKVTLALVGDVLPAAKVLELMKANGFDYPFREAKPYLEAADITAGNLETPITARGTPAEDKQYVFRGSSDTVPALKEAGFDFFSLANNHTLDYGWVGLSDTMDALDDAELQHAGSGNDDKEAFEPAYIERNGMTVAFIGLSRVVPDVSWKADRNRPGVAEAYSPERAVAAIKEAKVNADLVVAMVHWGVERADHPVDHQKDLAHRFVDAGADLVIGSHPHVLQGFESYKGKWIAYSLGNFVFSTTSVRSSETGVLNAECGKNGDCALKFVPMFATRSQPAPMGEAEGKALLARLSSLSIGARVEEDGTIVAKN